MVMVMVMVIPLPRVGGVCFCRLRNDRFNDRKGQANHCGLLQKIPTRTIQVSRRGDRRRQKIRLRQILECHPDQLRSLLYTQVIRQEGRDLINRPRAIAGLKNGRGRLVEAMGTLMTSVVHHHLLSDFSYCQLVSPRFRFVSHGNNLSLGVGRKRVEVQPALRV
jgi:hypothetical protein